jgi:hypothetical protein
MATFVFCKYFTTTCLFAIRPRQETRHTIGVLKKTQSSFFFFQELANTLLNKNIITEHITNELWCKTVSRRIKDQGALDLQSRHLIFLLMPSAAVFC